MPLTHSFGFLALLLVHHSIRAMWGLAKIGVQGLGSRTSCSCSNPVLLFVQVYFIWFLDSRFPRASKGIFPVLCSFCYVLFISFFFFFSPDPSDQNGK